jgi:ABC-type glycerol-3-phosphate transport system permease component
MQKKNPEMRIGELTPWEWLMRILTYILLTAFGFIIIFPFLYMMFTSLKSSTDVFHFPPRLLPYSPQTVEYEGAEVAVYRFELDGQVRGLISTGEKVAVGFFTNEEFASATNARDSQIVAEIALDQATDLGETVTISRDGSSVDYAVYEAAVDGATQRLLLAYSPRQDVFFDPTDPSVRVFGTVRTAEPLEFVDYQTENYQAFFDLNLDRSLVNTTLVTILVVTGQLISSIFGGYAFSRVEFRGRDTLFLVYLGSIMIPFVVLIIPIYRLMVILNWQNQIVSLIVPWIFTAYGTFLMRQFFISIPKELEEAALLDGASRFRILWQMFVPLSMPAIATLAIFSFLYAWNSFLWPLLIIGEGNEANHVLTLSLIRLSNVAADRPNIVLTGAAIAILPPMIIFVLAQKYFIEGVATSGLKG